MSNPSKNFIPINLGNILNDATINKLNCGFINIGNNNNNNFYIILQLIIDNLKNINNSGNLKNKFIEDFFKKNNLSNILNLRSKIIDFLTNPIDVNFTNEIYDENFFKISINTSYNYIDEFLKKLVKNNIYILKPLSVIDYKEIINKYFFNENINNSNTVFYFKKSEFEITDLNNADINFLNLKLDQIPDLKQYLDNPIVNNDTNKYFGDIIGYFQKDPNIQKALEKVFKSFLLDEFLDSKEINNIVNSSGSNSKKFLESNIPPIIKNIQNITQSIKKNIFKYDSSKHIENFTQYFLTEQNILQLKNFSYLTSNITDDYYFEYLKQNYKISLNDKLETLENIDDKIINDFFSKDPRIDKPNKMNQLLNYPLNIGYFYVDNGYFLSENTFDFDEMISNINDKQFKCEYLPLFKYIINDFKIIIIKKDKKGNLKYYSSYTPKTVEKMEFTNFFLDNYSQISINFNTSNPILLNNYIIVYYDENTDKYNILVENLINDEIKITYDSKDNLIIYLLSKIDL